MRRFFNCFSLLVVLLVERCDGVAELLPYQNVATDLTFDFLIQAADGPLRTFDINLSSDIHFFGEDIDKITIFESGVVILKTNSPLGACPSTLDTITENEDKYISVYWRRAILFLQGRGQIFFQERAYNNATDGKILTDIRTAFAKRPGFEDVDIDEEDFQPLRLVIITWHDVAAVAEGQWTNRNTFQLVIASDDQKSFGLFLYKNIDYYVEQDQTNNLCIQPSKIGIRNEQLTYWISNEVQLLEQAKRIGAFSNIKLYDKDFLGRYALRFFGVRSRTDGSMEPVLFPRPAPALHQNCNGPNRHEVCDENVDVAFCIGKTGEHRHPNLCTHYVHCDHDTVIAIKSCPGVGADPSCPEGMSWNAHHRLCSCDNSQNCASSRFTAGQGGGTEGPPTPIHARDLDCEYMPDGNYVNFADCGSYFGCSNGRNIKIDCGHGLKWNPHGANGGYSGSCDWARNVDCSRNGLAHPTLTTTRTTPTTSYVHTTSATSPWGEWTPWSDCLSLGHHECIRLRGRTCSRSSCQGEDSQSEQCECIVLGP